MARILLAEDHDQLRRMLVVLLEDLGHEVVPAADGAQALEAAQWKSVDLLITDYAMPNMDGAELVRALDGGAPPIIVYSASNDPKLGEILDNPHVCFVSKARPVSELVSCIDDLLAEVELRGRRRPKPSSTKRPRT